MKGVITMRKYTKVKIIKTGKNCEECGFALVPSEIKICDSCKRKKVDK